MTRNAQTKIEIHRSNPAFWTSFFSSGKTSSAKKVHTAGGNFPTLLNVQPTAVRFNPLQDPHCQRQSSSAILAGDGRRRTGLNRIEKSRYFSPQRFDIVYIKAVYRDTEQRMRSVRI